MDDFYLPGAFPAPKAEAGFVEHFDRSYSLWLEDRLSNTSGEEWDALWDYWTGRSIANCSEGEPDVIWLADAFSSFAQLVGDYVAAGVDRVEFEFAADNPEPWISSDCTSSPRAVGNLSIPWISPKTRIGMSTACR